MRPLTELKADTSGWVLLKELFKTAKNKVDVLPATNSAKAAEALYQTQVTTHSYMGAIIYYTGGLLIDNGWIRLLGSGSPRFTRTLPGWNKGKTFKEFGERPGYLLIGDDAIGGFFAINGGALGPEMGKVYYLAPETLKWESLQKGYSDFVDFCLNGDLDKFYEAYRWKDWQTGVKGLHGDSVYNFYPTLWSKEGRDIQKDTRKIVPVQEQYDFNMDSIRQFNIK
ncbi:DUF2625 domain-containing protein [Mucilaginibacter sp. ZT4R22]|uniref:DUF2625 domain-containing protein n=1 Tax=Mucilaginibacter pankratovii TaxID=2772110 RepID=A0ABR7WKE8_9SPHI|nr:DUF2625 domain-containing protein [Mucilaginibacter pankratovii]MBD1362800.1 DUF2625 domain-containing protein [Mucilaginibacter pankratovii]